MTAREFNQQVGRAQRVADDEPVMVTRHGEPAYVLLSIDEYERLQGDRGEGTGSFFDRIAAPEMTAGEDALFAQVMSEVEGERKRDFGRPPLEW